ncbi:MAG: MOSC N-terminal beta barrel domain-containing protein [Ferruginibacter sp.]
MDIKPTVSRITIYPVKSLDGVSLQESLVGEGGCLLHDREYAIADLDGNLITGKRNPLIHFLRSTIDFENDLISFRQQEETTWHSFHIQKETQAIDFYLSEFFGIPSKLLQNKYGRFLDIPDISGITILSTASLRTVAHWFDDMNLEETRRRFRATIEIEGVPPFWEDQLFSKKDTTIEYTIGEVTLFGISPRARCIVPTRNPETGEGIHSFPKTFAGHRAASLPIWSNLKEFGHYYHLSVDCYIPPGEIGKYIRVGNEVTIVGEKILK